MPPTALDQDYSEIFDYPLGVGSDAVRSTSYTSGDSSAGYQTFPETPVFSASLFSPARICPPSPVTQCPRPPRSATLPSPGHHPAKGILTRPKSAEIHTPMQGIETFPPRPLSIASSVPVTSPGPPGPCPLPYLAQGSSPSLPNKVSPIEVAKESLGSSEDSLRSESRPGIDSSQPGGSSPASLQSRRISPMSSNTAIAHVSLTRLTPSPCDISSTVSSASVLLPKPDGTTLSPLSSHNEPHPSLPAMLPSPYSPLALEPSPSVINGPQLMHATVPLSSSAFGRSFLPSLTPSPPVSPKDASKSNGRSTPTAIQDIAPHVRLPPTPVTASSLAPPPYHTIALVKSEAVPPLSDTPDYSALHTQCGATQERDTDLCAQLRPSRGKLRPPLPSGPRRPSAPAQPLGTFVPGFRDRLGSESAVFGGNRSGDPPSSPWTKLHEAASKPLPKFQAPRPKWRGLTMEAAQWTLTSTQLQDIVSRATQQSAEGSSIRLFRLDVLDGEIAEETHRVEMHCTDIKSRYKALIRKRWQLMGALAGHLETRNPGHEAVCTMEELAEVCLTLDQLADELHNATEQFSQLKSLRDVHHASALAVALRKVNTSFLHQVAENQKLLEQIDALKAERDEGWKQAQDVALEYDKLNDQITETAGESSTTKPPNHRYSARILAIHKSSIRRSKAGLRLSTSRRRSGGSVGTRSSCPSAPTSACRDGAPPLPPLRLIPLDPTTGSLVSGVCLLSYMSSQCSFLVAHAQHALLGSTLYHPSTSAARALSHAQQELYDMLGLDFESPPNSVTSARPRSMTRSSDPPLSLRPCNARENRAIHSMILDDVSLASSCCISDDRCS